MNHKPYATFNDLWPELLQEILSRNHPQYPITSTSSHDDIWDVQERFQQPRWTELACAKKWLRDVSTVNHNWHMAALPLIYSTSFLSMDPCHQKGLEDRLEQVKKYGRFVRYLIINFGDDRDDWTPPPTALFKGLGLYLSGCLIVHVNIQRHHSRSNFAPVHTLFESFDCPDHQVRVVQIRSPESLSYESVAGMLGSIPDEVASRLEILQIAGWKMLAPGCTPSTSPSVVAKFPHIKRLSLGFIHLPKSLTSHALARPLSLTFPSTYLTSLAISKTLLDSSSIVSILKTPTTGTGTIPHSGGSTLGSQLTSLQLEVVYPVVLEDMMRAPFIICSLCPNLRKLSYISLTPIAFLLPSHAKRLKLSNTFEELDIPDGPIAKLRHLTDLDLRNLSASSWGHALLAGVEGIEQIIEWAKNPKLRGNVKRLFVDCDYMDDFETYEERVQRELGRNSEVGLDVLMTARKKGDKAMVPDTFELTGLIEDL